MALIRRFGIPGAILEVLGVWACVGALGCGDQQSGSRGSGGNGGQAGSGSGGSHTGGMGGHATGGASGAAGQTAGTGGGVGGSGGGVAGSGGGAAGSGGGAAGSGGGAAGSAGGAPGKDGGIDAAGGSGAQGCPQVDGGTTAAGAPDSINFFPNVTVSTFAGGASPPNLTNPVGVAIVSGGGLVVSDFDANDLVSVSTTGVIAGLTQQGTFTRPYALAYDAAHNKLYAQTDADPTGAHGLTTATIWTIASNGAASNIATDVGTARGMAVLSDGRLVLSDGGNHVIRLLDPSNGKVTVLAGTTSCIGSVDGTGSGADFNDPYGVAVLPNDDIVVADFNAGILRKVTLAGVVTTFAGDGGPPGTPGQAVTIDGPALMARFTRPRAIAADAAGVVYVSDEGEQRIRRIGTDGTVTTLAGNGTMGFMDGPGNMAEFYGQEGIAVTSDGKTVYVADGTAGSDTPVAYHRIRAISIGP
jgi:sugar lactone lactonase YvrE